MSAVFPLVTLVGFSFLVAATPLPARAETAYIQVGQAKTRKTVLALAPIRAGDAAKAAPLAKIVADTVTADLLFMDLFRFLPSAGFLEPGTAGIAPGSFKFTDWNGLGTDFLLKARLDVTGDNLSLETYVYEVATGKTVLTKKYVALARDAKIVAHTWGNQIVEALTGLPGIFLTKIAMSCDRGGHKEIYVMNFDGSEVKQVTRHGSTAISPAWHPDGTKIAYSVYTKNRKNIKNLDLWEFDFARSTTRLLSNRKGINSGAQYSPDGSKIALTMSFLGNPDIFLYEFGAGSANNLRRITNSFGVDVDPNWSPDGKQIAFVSSRTGASMLFKMRADGSSPQRLTYAGTYNATPTWSPNGSKIGFAGMIDRVFDIFLINPDGTNIQRLSKGQGNNEDPHFSPDGGFITFSSNRAGTKNIYAMNVDGTFVKRLTFGLGNCTSPKWSRPPR